MAAAPGGDSVPFFSVIIPSRNRPRLLARAVQSVLTQDFNDLELIVVDDGSEQALDTAALATQYDHRPALRVLRLEPQPRGRGPAYARNVGVWASRGRWCAFLDDDDCWIRADHLSTAHSAISHAGSTVDLYLADQEAVDAQGLDPRRLWLYPLVRRLAEAGAGGACQRVSVEQLLDTGGFSHLNTTLVSRALFDRLGGLDEFLSYEEDLDFFLRAIDHAGGILLRPEVIGRHYVPAANGAANVSTAAGYLRRMSMRLRLLDRGMLEAAHPAIREYCRRYGADTLKHLAQDRVAATDFIGARTLALRALATRFGFKWLLYSAYLCLRSCLPRSAKQ